MQGIVPGMCTISAVQVHIDLMQNLTSGCPETCFLQVCRLNFYSRMKQNCKEKVLSTFLKLELLYLHLDSTEIETLVGEDTS